MSSPPAQSMAINTVPTPPSAGRLCSVCKEPMKGHSRERCRRLHGYKTPSPPRRLTRSSVGTPPVDNLNLVADHDGPDPGTPDASSVDASPTSTKYRTTCEDDTDDEQSDSTQVDDTIYDAADDLGIKDQVDATSVPWASDSSTLGTTATISSFCASGVPGYLSSSNFRLPKSRYQDPVSVALEHLFSTGQAVPVAHIVETHERYLPMLAHCADRMQHFHCIIGAVGWAGTNLWFTTGTDKTIVNHFEKMKPGSWLCPQHSFLTLPSPAPNPTLWTQNFVPRSQSDRIALQRLVDEGGAITLARIVETQEANIQLLYDAAERLNLSVRYLECTGKGNGNFLVAIGISPPILDHFVKVARDNDCLRLPTRDRSGIWSLLDGRDTAVLILLLVTFIYLSKVSFSKFVMPNSSDFAFEDGDFRWQ